MANTKKITKKVSQITVFRKTARDLGCDESEAAFDKALKKIGKAKDHPKKAAK